MSVSMQEWELEDELEEEASAAQDEGEAEFLNTIMSLASRVLGSQDMQEAEAEAEFEKCISRKTA